MDSDVEQWLLAQGGLASTSQLLALGVDRRCVNRWVAQGGLRRIAKGVVVAESVWQSAMLSERHRLRAQAALLSPWHGSVALSHQSSLAMAGLPLFGVDQRVHLMRLDGTRHKSTPELAFHQVVDPEWLIPCGQQSRVRESLAALQVADAFGVEAGLVAADAIAHAGVGSAVFAEALSAGRFARGFARPQRVVELVDARMESPGESRCRWLFHLLCMPDAEPQVSIRLPSGRLARVDFLFRDQRTIVEFDGLAKYDGGRPLIEEKAREDELRRAGYQVVRLIWKDLSRSSQVQAWLVDAFDVARRSQVA